MSTLDSVSTNQGAIARAVAAPGSAAGAAATGFDDALSALLSAAGSATPTMNQAASVDAEKTVAEPAASAAAMPSMPPPILARSGCASGKATADASKAAPLKASTGLQGDAPLGAASPETASASAEPPQGAEEAQDADAAPKDAGAKPEADAGAADATAPLMVATPAVALPAATRPQDTSPTLAGKDDRAAPASGDRPPAGGADALAGSEKTAVAVLPAATSTAGPPAPVISAAPTESFAERLSAAAVSASAARPASSDSSKTATTGAAAAPSSGAPTSAAAPVAGAVTAFAVAAVATADTQGGGDHAGDGGAGGAGGSTPAEPSPSTASAPAAAAAPSAAVGGAPDTVASFAAALVQRLGQRISRFQVVLNPEGLGRVDVSMKIDAQGALTAHIACDEDSGADALKGRTSELAASLQQAGFSIAADALRIDAPPPAAAGSLFAGTDASGDDARDQRPASAAWRGADLSTLDAGNDLIPAAYAIAGRARGLDIRI